jgi:hypothetical protein
LCSGRALEDAEYAPRDANHGMHAAPASSNYGSISHFRLRTSPSRLRPSRRSLIRSQQLLPATEYSHGLVNDFFRPLLSRCSVTGSQWGGGIPAVAHGALADLTNSPRGGKLLSWSFPPSLEAGRFVAQGGVRPSGVVDGPGLCHTTANLTVCDPRPLHKEGARAASPNPEFRVPWPTRGV